MSQEFHPIFATDLTSVRLLLTDRRTSAARSRPEETPELNADDVEREHSYESPVSGHEDRDFHVLGRKDAIAALSTALEVPRRQAEEYLDLGAGGVEAIRPYSGKRGEGRMFRAGDVHDWVEQYKSRKQQRATDKSQEKLHVPSPAPWQRGMKASAFDDVDSVGAGKLCFGDRAQNRGFRQDTHFLSDEYFRSDLFRG